MIHRGPDAAGDLDEPGIAMSMRRLSIIDRATGQQPQFNEDGDVAVISNGEIYNFQELRYELTRKGHRFCTLSDTEAIVHAYEEWGEACLSRLRGMFALAIYDRRPGAVNDDVRGRLLLARDRLGIKPLYYVRASGLLLFASEVRALLASRAFMPELSPAGLESYLLFGSVSEPGTLIEGVRSLPPGHALNVPLGSSSTECDPRQYLGLEFRREWPAGRRGQDRRSPRANAADTPRRQHSRPSDLGRAAWHIPQWWRRFNRSGCAGQPSPIRCPLLHRALPRTGVRRVRGRTAHREAPRRRSLRTAGRRGGDAQRNGHGNRRARSTFCRRHQHLLCFRVGAKSRRQSGAVRPRWRRAVRRLSHLPMDAATCPPVGCRPADATRVAVGRGPRDYHGR